MSKRLVWLELKSFLGRRAIVALLFLIASGAAGIAFGQAFVARQRAVIGQVPDIQAARLAREIALNPSDLGNLLYSAPFSAVDNPSDWAAFSFGQRDVNPYVLSVRLLTLEGQLYASDHTNPNALLFGAFDLSFVLIFLFPLAVIAFAHDAASADVEAGIRPLVRAQATSGLATVVGVRLAIRFAVVLTAAVALIAGFAASSGIDARLVYALLIAAAYLAFWFGLAAFIVSFDRPTSFNALVLLGVWTLLAIVGPAIVNLAVSTALPVSEGFAVTVSQREGYHRKWDLPKSATMDAFYLTYPQFREFPVPEEKFSWGWYYAMQNAGDVEAAAARDGYLAKLGRRERWTETAALFLPTVAAQLSFNRLAGTDLGTHLAFLESVRDHHRAIREHFYPLIFNGSKTSEVDWTSLPAHRFKETPAGFPTLVIPMFAMALLLTLSCYRRLRARLA